MVTTFALLLAVFATALAAPGAARLGRGANWLLAVVPAGLTVLLLAQVPAVADGESIAGALRWVAGLRLAVTLRLDGLAMLFALLITGVGTLIVIYSGSYLGGHPLRGRFYAYLLLFMGAMLGLVLADNLLVLYVFWELTSISSWLLIGFDHEKPKAREAAWQALVITSGGGLALLAGLILLGQVAGTYELSAVLREGQVVRDSALYPVVLVLLLVGAFTKSAQVPFHVWLPNAMEAPTPVSAYLHSATMVKAGIYLLARFTPVLAGTDAWHWVVSGVGALTMVVGAWLAIIQTDLKRLLAYSTISALGMMVLMLGIGGEQAVSAALAFLLAHALYKGALFLVAGALDHEVGTRDAAELRGLRRAMPITAVAAGLAWASMVGLPPTLGFVGHDAFYQATEHQQPPATAWVLTGLATLASILYAGAAGVVALRPFWGRQMLAPSHPHEAPAGMWLGPLVLAGCGVLLSPFLSTLSTMLIAPATSAILGRTAHPEVSLWHGWKLALGLSIATVLGGIVVYLLSRRLREAVRPWRWLARWGADSGYEQLIAGMNGLAQWQTRWLQHGYLPTYLLVAVLTMLVLVGWPLLAGPLPPLRIGGSGWHLAELALAGITLAGALATALFSGRVAAIVSMGVVGYAVALYFVLYAAPDLAVTQFLVETLFVVLVVLNLPRLPRLATFTSRAALVRNAVIALGAGALLSVILLSVSARPPDPTIPRYYSERSLPEAHGRNVVNVILVDFRSLDTLVEITVLSTAAVGVCVLLRLRLPGRLPRPNSRPEDLSQEARLGEDAA